MGICLAAWKVVGRVGLTAGYLGFSMVAWKVFSWAAQTVDSLVVGTAASLAVE